MCKYLPHYKRKNTICVILQVHRDLPKTEVRKENISSAHMMSKTEVPLVPHTYHSQSTCNFYHERFLLFKISTTRLQVRS